MTAAFAAQPRGYRLTMWLAHREPHGLAFAVVANAAAVAADRVALGPPLFRALLSLLAIAGAVWAVAGASAAGRHRHALCTRCARKIPTDGPTEAALHGRALRVFHWCHSWPGIIMLTAGAVLLVVLTLAGANALVRALAGSPLLALMAVEAAAGLRHRPLEPWCPYCPHWGGGGDHEPSPAPTPDPQGVKSV